AEHRVAVDGHAFVHRPQGYLGGDPERPATMTALEVETQLAAVEVVAGAEAVEHRNVVPGGDAERRHVDQERLRIDNAQAFAQVEVAEAEQEVEFPVAAPAELVTEHLFIAQKPAVGGSGKG